MIHSFDAVVIGTGQAGPSLAARLVQEGLKTAIVERKSFGGTCVNVGCIPTKTLVASARVAHMARRASEFGVEVPGNIAVDMGRVRARKDEVVQQSNSGVENWLKGMDGCQVFEGHARLEKSRDSMSDQPMHRVRVGAELLEAPKVFLNTGGRPLVPEMPGLDQVPFLTSSSIMNLDFLPEHLVVVGGSYIGLEFAQMYKRFGSRVTVVDRNERLISREEEAVSLEVQSILENEGIEVRLGAQCMSVEPIEEGFRVSLDCGEGSRQVMGSHLLLAVGRVPNTHDLGLEMAGVQTTARGVVEVDDQLRTSVPGIWALGDINGKGAFTHTAYNDYEIVAANLFDGDTRGVNDRIPCYGLFIDPPLGRVGWTEDQVRASGRPALVGSLSMERVGRARERSETQGFMKVLVDAESEEVLGAAILGIGGDEVVHCLLDIMYAKASYRTIQRAVHIHPTVSELIPTLLGNLKPL